MLFVHVGLEHYNLLLIEFRKLYWKYCDWGAYCVNSLHPHVAQGIEKYNEKLIFYSLGNFFFLRTPNSIKSNIEDQSFFILLNFNNNKVSYTLVFHFVYNLKVNLTLPEHSLVKLECLNNILISLKNPSALQEVV